MPELQQEQTIGELLGHLAQDTGLLVRQEVQLARIEVQAVLSRATRDAVSLAAGGLVMWLGALALTAALVLLLIEPIGLNPWLASLLVGVVLAIAGYLTLRRGLQRLKAIDPTPRRAVESVKDDIQWAKEQVS